MAIAKEANPQLKTFIIYSDGCSGQNRCCVLTGSLLKLSHDLNITIIQKYLDVGQSRKNFSRVCNFKLIEETCLRAGCAIRQLI